MTSDPLRSIPGVVTVVRFGETTNAPDLLLEVPHAATRRHHFDELLAQLRGDYDPQLREFYFVNTDVGAPELAAAIARGVVAAGAARSAIVVASQLPRTFIDCNRSIDQDTVAKASAAGEMTPGLQPWVSDERDRELLLTRYFQYRETAQRAVEEVCGAGGRTLCVHAFAPRSIDIAVDTDIVTALRREYVPERLAQWPLRPEIDLITRTPEGRELADADLADRIVQACTTRGLTAQRNTTYGLHPATLAFEFANRFPGSTLCFEARRDLLLEEFVPFRELDVDETRVEQISVPFVQALSA